MPPGQRGSTRLTGYGFSAHSYGKDTYFQSGLSAPEVKSAESTDHPPGAKSLPERMRKEKGRHHPGLLKRMPTRQRSQAGNGNRQGRAGWVAGRSRMAGRDWVAGQLGSWAGPNGRDGPDSRAELEARDGTGGPDGAGGQIAERQGQGRHRQAQKKRRLTMKRRSGGS